MKGSQQRPPEPIKVTFVLWDSGGGIAVKHDGEVVWRDTTAVSTWDQYLRFKAPRGVPVVIEVEERPDP